MDKETSAAVARCLELIPDHDVRSIVSRDEYRARVRGALPVHPERAAAYADFTLLLLDLFDARRTMGAARTPVKTATEMQTYLKRSLSWYLRSGNAITSDWSRPGTSGDLEASVLLHNAPYFLKALEEKRLRIGETLALDVGWSRLQKVSICLIKKRVKSKIFILHQWDETARRFQMIGGKFEKGETPVKAAVRELKEEITRHALVEGRHFELLDLTATGPLVSCGVSPTYGALTRYETYVFHVAFQMPDLKLSKIDRWIPIGDIRKGRTSKGQEIASKDWLLGIERTGGRKIVDLPDSL
jgi:8-oxo-dGTP pyrophosphatase MutT (NUDIX family)